MNVSIRRERASPLAVLIAYLVTLIVLYALTSSVNPAETRTVSASLPSQITQDLTLSCPTVYFADLGTYRTAAEARPDAARLAGRGSAAYLHTLPDGVHVFGNAYETLADAEKICARLNKDGISAQIRSLTSPSLTLRITAADTQIPSIENAWNALSAAKNTLISLSARLDGQTTTADAARTEALICAYETQTAAEPFLKASENASSAVIMSLRALLNDACTALRSLSCGSESSLYLSSRIKHTLIGICLAQSAWLNTPD